MTYCCIGRTNLVYSFIIFYYNWLYYKDQQIIHYLKVLQDRYCIYQFRVLNEYGVTSDNNMTTLYICFNLKIHDAQDFCMVLVESHLDMSISC